MTQPTPRILIVEDERMISKDLERLLKGLGYGVAAVVASGEDAVQKAEECNPDLVLMDIMLEGELDGVEAANLIHSRYSIPAVFVTAHADKQTLERASLTDSFGYLVKPCSEQELRTTIEIALYKAGLERQLRENEERLRSIVETANDAITCLDTDGKIVFWNPAAEAMFGYTADEIMGKPLSLVIPEWFDQVDDAELLRLLKDAQTDSPRQTLEVVGHRKDKTELPAELSMAKWQTDKGIFFTTIIRDVTEWTCAQEELQRARDELEDRVDERTAELRAINESLRHEIAERERAEEALRLSEERFRAISETARDCITIKDVSRKFTHVNPAYEDLFGIPAHRLIGLRSDDLLNEEEAKHSKEVDLRILQGESVEEEIRATINGAAHTFHVIKVPLRNAYGEVTGICGISRDITERKKAGPPQPAPAEEYSSSAMKATLKMARQAGTTDGTVLLLGESGSGKDYLARWIHDHSLRARGPFFTINCAAVPKELAESELFGHESGAFTGARGRKRGLLELAEGGTLLLNEIGDLPPSLQSKLLTFLDTKSFHRVGSEKSTRVNARLIAATHRDLNSEVASGQFLEPLFYRLNVFLIEVPPLRKRIEDIPVLVEQTLGRVADDLQLSKLPEVDSSSMRVLSQYQWPGNVRELRNVLERAVMLSDGGLLNVSVPLQHNRKVEGLHTVHFPTGRTLRNVTDDVIHSLCLEGLRRCNGSKTRAARLLGISRDSLYRYMKRFGIPKD